VKRPRRQLSLLGEPTAQPRIDRGVLTTPEIDRLLSGSYMAMLDRAQPGQSIEQLFAPVAIGVSGGKDSCALAFATVEHLDAVGHRGPRILIHSDLGRVEWKDSAPTCARLADRLGLELVTVRREAGDMMDRWLVRWRNNVARYQALSCVCLILPWSTASMRFCTSEMKTAIICRELVRRWPGRTILSACGIRREESTRREKAPIAKVQAKLTSATNRTSGIDWNPILDWTVGDVLAFLAARGFPLHEAYTRFGSSRVSCAFCVLASQGDIAASANCPDNADIYREMVDLEIVSSFSLQSNTWLGDVAPHLLTEEQRAGLADAKQRAARREAIEARIPKHLRYMKGWPTCVPSRDEAELLAETRRNVAAVMRFTGMRCLDADSVIERYEELIAAKAARGGEDVADEAEAA